MSNYRNETLAIRIQNERSPEAEHSVPLYLTSSYVFDDAEQMRAAFSDEIDANIYSRYSNPNVDELLEIIAVLEAGEAAWGAGCPARPDDAGVDAGSLGHRRMRHLGAPPGCRIMRHLGAPPRCRIVGVRS